SRQLRPNRTGWRHLRHGEALLSGAFTLSYRPLLPATYRDEYRLSPTLRSLIHRDCRDSRNKAPKARAPARVRAPDQRALAVVVRAMAERDETHAFEALEHPAHRGPMGGLFELVGGRLAGDRKLLTYPVLSEAADQEAEQPPAEPRRRHALAAGAAP